MLNCMSAHQLTVYMDNRMLVAEVLVNSGDLISGRETGNTRALANLLKAAAKAAACSVYFEPIIS